MLVKIDLKRTMYQLMAKMLFSTAATKIFLPTKKGVVGGKEKGKVELVRLTTRIQLLEWVERLARDLHQRVYWQRLKKSVC
jgi:hypothetical protein